MLHERNVPPPVSQVDRIMEKYQRLTPAQQTVVDGLVDRLLEQQP
jgi:hypothetical protein